MKVYASTKFFEAVRTGFIAYLEVQKDIQTCDELSRRGAVGAGVQGVALGMEDDSLLGTDGRGSFAQGFIDHRFTQMETDLEPVARIVNDY